DEEEHRHEHGRIEHGDTEPSGDRRRVLADREEHVEQRCKETRPLRRPHPGGRLHGADRSSRRRAPTSFLVVGRLLLLQRRRLDRSLVAFLVDLYELPLVTLELLPPAALLLRRHGDYRSARRPATIGSMPRSPPRWYAR